MTGRAAAIAGILAVALAWSAVAVPALELDVIPRAGYRLGGDLQLVDGGGAADAESSAAWGLGLGIPFDAALRSRLELVWSHQSTDLDAVSPDGRRLGLDLDYLHLGGIVPYPTSSPAVDWFLSGGLGVTGIRASGARGSDEVRFSASVGGGIQTRMSERIALRFEARGWFTFVDSSLALYCSGGVCLVEFESSGFWQVETSVGLVLGVGGG